MAHGPARWAEGAMAMAGAERCAVCGYHNEVVTGRCLYCREPLPQRAAQADQAGGRWSGELLAALGPWSPRALPRFGRRFAAGALLGLVASAPWPLMGYRLAVYLAHASDSSADYPVMARLAQPVGMLWHVALALTLAKATGGVVLLVTRRTRATGYGLLATVGAGGGLCAVVCVVSFAVLLRAMAH